MDAPAIMQKDELVLRQIAAPIPGSLFGTPKLRKIINGMALALDGEPDGVAIAAPQIGEPYRLFLVRYDRVAPPPPKGTPPRPADIGIYANPAFLKTSRKREPMDEGCLSVRGKYGKVHRHTRATVRAQDENGAWFERGGGGLLAQIFQHEIDHLNGVLFIDSAVEVVDRSARKKPAAEKEPDASLETDES